MTATGMRGVTFASVRTHRRRYVAAVGAIVCAVAFVLVTDLLASATRGGFQAGTNAVFRGSDVVASGLSAPQVDRLLAAASHEGARASVVATTYATATQQSASGHDVTTVDSVDAGVISSDPSQRWQHLVSGRLPTGRGEVVVDRSVATSNDVRIGDRISYGDTKPLELRVVGIVDAPKTFVSASLYMSWPDLERAATPSVEGVTWAASGSTAGQIAHVRTLLHADADAKVMSRADHVAQEQKRIDKGVDVIALLLLFFAAVAAFVAVMVIANTFSILLTQRLRDLALLRCIGATRRQVLRSLRTEALVLAVASSLLGVVVGLALGYGVVAVIRGLTSHVPLATPTPSPAWALGGFLLGVVTTLVASLLPVRRVLKVSPLAALRPAESLELRSAAGRIRIALAVVLGAVGVLFLVAAVSTRTAIPMIAGGFATFGAVLLLGPIIVPAAIRLAGVVLRPVLGRTGRFSVQNATRNPRRTATTTGSLLVGVTLLTATLTGISSATGAVDHSMDTDQPVDVSLTGDAPLATGTVSDLRALPGVARTVTLTGLRAHVSGPYGDLPLLVVPPAATSVTRSDPSFMHPRPGTIALPAEGSVPTTVTVEHAGHRLVLHTVAAHGIGMAGVLSPTDLARLGGGTPLAVWVRAQKGADSDDLNAGVKGIARTAGGSVDGGYDQRTYVALQLRILTWSVLALLGVAVLIALVGIANTLGLSVLERRRGNSLLRALGMTRSQLRRSLAAEAVLLGSIAALLGVVLGLAYAWVGVQVMVVGVTGPSRVVVPWALLAAVVVGAGGAALLAAVLPARRAARTVPAAGLALD